MGTYTQEFVDNLFKRWKGVIHTFGEGCLLAFDIAILTKEGFKSVVIKERYLNEWSSAYSVRQYKKLPIKYMTLLNV